MNGEQEIIVPEMALQARVPGQLFDWEDLYYARVTGRATFLDLKPRKEHSDLFPVYRIPSILEGQEYNLRLVACEDAFANRDVITVSSASGKPLRAYRRQCGSAWFSVGIGTPILTFSIIHADDARVLVLRHVLKEGKDSQGGIAWVHTELVQIGSRKNFAGGPYEQAASAGFDKAACMEQPDSRFRCNHVHFAREAD